MKEEIKLPLECDHASDDMGECCECYSTLEYWLEEAQLKLKELTALHAEVSGRNVTLHCKNLELEGKVKEYEKMFEERGHAFQEAQNKTLLENQKLEGQVKILTEGLEKIRGAEVTNIGWAISCAEETLTASEKWAGRKE